MKVSIMITTYNLENYIKQTMESVLSQNTDFPYEILIGDDGSTDGTLEILKNYQEKYPEMIQVFTMPRDSSKDYNKVERSAKNRLNLWQHAKGEYACFLDGDDFYLDDNRLKRMVDILDHPNNQDCSMCAHNLLMFYGNGNDFPLCQAKKERKLSLNDYWKLMFLQANAVLFRNNYSEKKPEGAVAANFDDNNITFWFFQFGKMYYLPECMGAYRQLEDSSWNSNDAIKKNCSNMIGFNVEQLIAPEAVKLSEIRHYKELEFLVKHKEELSVEKCQPFYGTAKEQNLAIALSIYEMGQLNPKDRKKLKTILRRGRRGYYLAKFERVLLKLVKKY